MNRKEKLVSGEYYHVYNRGVEKRRIFLSKDDYQRFEDLLFHYLLTNEKFTASRERIAAELRNLKTRLTTTSEAASEAASGERDHSDVPRRGKLGSIFQQPVALVAYVLMPNHFHLLLKQLAGKGITNYIHRVTTSLTNHFNKKNERVGPLFQGVFKYKRVESEEQLIYLTKYIHRNPNESSQTKLATTRAKDYPWSSLPSYLAGDADLLFKEPILANFTTPDSYRKFVEEEYDDNQNVALTELGLDVE